MKLCSKCHVKKEEFLFFKDRSKKSGLYSRCKDCERILNRAKRLRNINSFKSKDASYYKNHREEITKKRKAYYESNKHKFIAHEAVKRALLKGVLVKESCENCQDKNTLAHHDDYTKPLTVRWLCVKHHMQYHHGK